MGQAKNWKRQFFRSHPDCCFCGGERAATTIDHQPGRIFFRRREWPEDFVFPACEQCNAASRQSEKALGVIIHGDAEEDDRAQFQANLASFKNEFPGEVNNLIFSTGEKRALFRSLGTEKPDGVAFKEMPLIRMSVEFWQPHFERFATKLLMALHYQHFGRPIPRAGGVYFAMYTNFDDMRGRFPSHMVENAPHYVSPIRNGRRLDDQFSVRFNAVRGEVDAAVFLMQFHKRLMFSGVTTARRDFLSGDAELIPPFRWD